MPFWGAGALAWGGQDAPGLPGRCRGGPGVAGLRWAAAWAEAGLGGADGAGV